MREMPLSFSSTTELRLANADFATLEQLRVEISAKTSINLLPPCGLQVPTNSGTLRKSRQTLSIIHLFPHSLDMLSGGHEESKGIYGPTAYKAHPPYIVIFVVSQNIDGFGGLPA